MKNLRIDYFCKRIFELYEVTQNHARSLFDKWKIEDLCSESEIDELLENHEIRQKFFIREDINIVKKYTLKDLEKKGITLCEVNKGEHIFKDSKYGIIWEEIFHPMADTWSGYYKVKDSLIE